MSSLKFRELRYITAGITCISGPASLLITQGENQPMPGLARLLPVSFRFIWILFSRKRRDKGFVRLMPLLVESNNWRIVFWWSVSFRIQLRSSSVHRSQRVLWSTNHLQNRLNHARYSRKRVYGPQIAWTQFLLQAQEREKQHNRDHVNTMDY